MDTDMLIAHIVYWIILEILMLISLLFPVFFDGWKAFELDLFLGLSILLTLGMIIMCSIGVFIDKFIV